MLKSLEGLTPAEINAEFEPSPVADATGRIVAWTFRQFGHGYVISYDRSLTRLSNVSGLASKEAARAYVARLVVEPESNH
jgi:hypothetical protein